MTPKHIPLYLFLNFNANMYSSCGEQGGILELYLSVATLLDKEGAQLTLFTLSNNR